MITLTIYDPLTGKIIQVLETNDPEQFDVNVKNGYSTLLGEYPPDKYYVKSGTPKVMPPAPGAWAQFDYATGEWFDPRTEDDHAAELQQWRNTAKLTKLQFLQGTMMVGLLTPSEAIQATTAVPDRFQPIIDALPPMMRDFAILNWGAATEVDRMDPFIMAIAQAANISDELLDLLFGYQAS